MVKLCDHRFRFDSQLRLHLRLHLTLHLTWHHSVAHLVGLWAAKAAALLATKVHGILSRLSSRIEVSAWA